MSSEYGDVTANDDVELTTLSLAGEEGREPERRRVRSSTDNYAIHERTDFKDILHMLYRLNDCIWCTNLFVMESDQGGNVITKGICIRKRECLYTSKDAKEELSYIDCVLDEMSEKILHVMENSDYGCDFTLLKDMVESWGLKKELEDSIEDYIEDYIKDYIIEIPSKTVAVAMINEINWEIDVHEKQLEINEKIKVANRFLGIISGNGEMDEDINSVKEALSRKAKKNAIPKDVQLTTGPDNFLHCCKSVNPLKATNIDSLLFEKEKWRITVVQRNGGDPIEHLEGIALPIGYHFYEIMDPYRLYSDHGVKRKDLLRLSLHTTEKMHKTKNVQNVQEKKQKTMFRKVFSFFSLLSSIIIYLSDIVSDLLVAVEHYSNGNADYAGLTLLFVFAPFIAGALSWMIWFSPSVSCNKKGISLWNTEYGKLNWKFVFSFNDFKIIKWMASSVKYALNSMRNYKKFAPCYADLHSYRRQKGKKEYRTNAAEDESEKADCYQIHTVFSSMLAWNERFTLKTKLAECLNESAPQFLLQLTIIIRQFGAGHQIGFKSWFSIVTSVLSLSWTIHMSHFDVHYDTRGGVFNVLNNSYEWRERAMEFVGNCFVYCSRLASICLVTSVLGSWAILGSMLYLIAIYFIMITCSGRKETYKYLHRYRTSTFWFYQRLFTLPCRIGIWRMDSIDHLLYYIETICLALSLPVLLPTVYDKSIAWIAAGVVLSFEALGIAVLYTFKRFFHRCAEECDIVDGDSSIL